MGIIGWIVLGLIAGAIAKAILPGDDPGGIIVTIIIGIVGAILGGFVRLNLDPNLVSAGPPVAPLAVATFALADERFGAGIGPLEPARAVR